MIKTICLAGDSHTWGEGAEKLLFKDFESPLRCGDKRLLRFEVPSFASLVRDYVNKESGSSATEFSADEPTGNIKPMVFENCVQICGRLSIAVPFGFARIEFKRSPFDAEIFCGGERVHIYRHAESDEYEVINILPKSHASGIDIVSEGALLYRAEFYDGKYAVLNCGIGSCTSVKYTDEYLEKYVLCAKPALVIAEVFTVNDWISAIPPSECEKNLMKFGKKILKSGADLAFSSAIPILGVQENSAGIAYDEYVHAGERAAKTLKIPYADVYSSFSAEYAECPTHKHYGDIRHPGPRGHEIYFENIKKLLTL